MKIIRVGATIRFYHRVRITLFPSTQFSINTLVQVLTAGLLNQRFPNISSCDSQNNNAAD